MTGAEIEEVEKPFLSQLAQLEWSTLNGHKWQPEITERSSFREVLLESRLLEALWRVNPGPDGQPWLDAARLAEAISTLTRPEAGNLVEINERMTERLLEGVSVSGVPDWDQGRSQRIQFIDFDHPERNDFLAVSQFRVDEQGGQVKRFVVPDIVLFVNGIPLVVIECKSPYSNAPMAEGIEQLQRYANRRQADQPEGNESLFWTNQFVISTYGDGARVGTFTADPDHFLPWKDPWPLTRAELAKQLSKPPQGLSGQELLVAGMLTPASLLDLVRHFTLFSETRGRRIKMVARYQQYRAVGKALARLRTGETRAIDGEVDRRGGYIWHTQGSGKSLTMVFLVRAIRSDPVLRAFKVVAITDRNDLEKQLAATARLSGETIQRARKVKQLEQVLSEHGPGMVFGMIQKYRDPDAVPADGQDDLTDETAGESVGVLNTDESILLLIDEAHRSQSSTLHANLIAALPNAAKIGFTGTPILREAKQKTARIFGPEIDRYTIREAEADQAVVPILYEGKTAQGAVKGASDLDELFEDMFVERTRDELRQLQARYATTGSVLEAPQLIAAKARSMLWHYVSAILPGGFKAQVSSTSRRAAVRYREALIVARDDLVGQIEDLPVDLVAGLTTGSRDIDAEDRKTQVLFRARQQLELIKALDFIPVISSGHNDPNDWARWTDKARQEAAVAAFKMPLGLASDDTSPLAFLLVRTMLLTGFDAPNEQVLYLDRFIQDADLLQAVARVNRTAPGKTAGYFVDYYGVGAHLQQAIKAYAPEDAADAVGAVTSIADELPKLRDRHARTMAIFTQAAIDRFDADEDREACVQVLADEALRARFSLRLKDFLASLDTVLPRPEALPYVKDAKRLGVIERLARRRYRDSDSADFDPSLYSAKVRALIDEHITALDIATKIPPVSITAPDFLAKVQGLKSDRAKASEMEHALRFHIRRNFDEDPAAYRKLSERLDKILESLSGHWDQLAHSLHELLDEVQSESRTIPLHADPLVVRIYGVFEQQLSTSGDLPDEVRRDILQIAERVADETTRHARLVNFWRNLHAQQELGRRLIQLLDERDDLFPFEEQAAMADRLLELVRANRSLLADRAPRGPS